MEKQEYQMTTVVKYVEMLDNDLNKKDEQIQSAAELYLKKMRKLRKDMQNAHLLEMLLA